MQRWFLLFVLLGSAPLFGEALPEASPATAAWKNCIGQTIYGTPITLNKRLQKVLFRRPDGTTVHYALTLFPEEERIRIRLALGEVPIPPPLLTQWDLTQNTIRRTRGLEAIGRTSPEEAARHLQTLRAALHKAIDACPDLSDAYRAALHQKAEE